MAESGCDTPPSLKLEDLSDRERELVDAARYGRIVICEPVLAVEELAVSADPSHQIRAEVIRALLLSLYGKLDPQGIRLAGAQVVGSLDLDHLHTVAPLSLIGCVISETLSARYAKLGRLDLSRSHLPALKADGLRIDGSLVLRETVIYGADPDSTVRLVGAHVGMQLSAENITIINTSGPAFHGDGLRVDDTLVFENAVIRGVSELGAVRLINAHITNEVNCRHAEVTNKIGVALHGEGIRVGGTMNLFAATVQGGGGGGAVRLLSAHIGNQLNLGSVEFSNTKGPALQAEQIHTGGFLMLERATLRGGGEAGAVLLSSAKIGDTLSCAGLRVENSSGLLLDLAKARVEGAISSLVDVVCPNFPIDHACEQSGQVNLNNLTFSALGRDSWDQWRHLIADHTGDYRPQPYQQLAAIERAAGHDGNARKVLISQQDDRYRRARSAIGNRGARCAHWMWGRLAGYGYRTRNLALALLLALGAASLMGYVAGQIPTRPGHYAAERVVPLGSATTAPGTRCSTVELIGLGIDRGLPLGVTGLRAKCDLDTSSRRGQSMTLIMWLIQAMLWGLITLAVAGYTNLVRKSS